jgi:hypothetical protein
MRRAVTIKVSLVLCGLWFLLTAVWEGNQVHSHIETDEKSVTVWLLGWIPILVIACLIILKREPK